MLTTALLFAVYLVLAALCLRLAGETRRFGGLAALSAAGLVALLAQAVPAETAGLVCAAYFALVGVHWLLLGAFARAADARWLLAFAAPIASLVGIKYLAFLWEPLWSRVPGGGELALPAAFLGLSYVALRLGHLVIEVRNGVVERPGFSRYLAFTFFLPTLPIGPISTYRTFHDSVETPTLSASPARDVQRIVVGAAKYLFLGSIFGQFSYSGLLLDGHPHPPLDLAVAMVAYYLFLYCNFSGICDMVIGASSLIGIRTQENFARPLSARSVQEFWTRWHITLGNWMRDVVFTPLSKALVARFGPRSTDHVIGFSIFVIFILVGVWHGVGWNFFFLGVVHAVAVTTNHYYRLLLRRVLGRRFRDYMASPAIRAVAVSATFLYVSASLFFFANDLDRMQAVWSAIDWGAR